MTLSAQDRRRYARHLSLPEIGDPGQERLQAARVGSALSPTTLDYLRRAGVVIEQPMTGSIESDWVRESSPHSPPLLEGEGAVLAGAWAAVEKMKEILGVGVPGTLEGFE